MSVLARYATLADTTGTGATLSNSGATVLTGPAAGTALDNTYGHLLTVRTQASGGTDPSMNTPSGWTLLAGFPLTATSGGYTEKLYKFAKRGDASTNSVSMSSTNSVAWRAVLLAVNGVTSDTFWATPTTSTGNTNVTSRAPSAQTTAYADMVAVASVGLSGTAGTGGIGWTNSFTTIKGTSQYDSIGVAYKQVASASTSVSTTMSWTTSGLSSGALVLLGCDASAPPVTVLDTGAGMCRVDARGSTSSPGPRTYSIAHTSGPDHSAGIEEVVEGYFLIPQDSASMSTYTVTTTDTGSSLTSTGVATVPAQTPSTGGLRMRVVLSSALT